MSEPGAVQWESCLCQLLAGHLPVDVLAGWQAADWAALQAAAQREGVAPLAYWYLKDQAAAAPGLAPLRASYYSALAQNTLLFKGLWKILAELQRADIPVLLLKGASLAHAYYPNIGVRPMGDLDLLFHQSDVARAAQALQRVGLQPLVTEDDANPGNLNIYARTFVNRAEGLHVELHWNLFGRPTHRYEPDLDWIWVHSQPFTLPRRVRVQVGEVRVMQPSLNFLYLCAHLVIKHRGAGERLLWYADLYQLQAAQALDWDWMAEAAESCHWGAGLHACLEKLQADFGVTLPPAYLAQVAARIEPADRQYLEQRGQIESNWQQIQAAITPLRWQDRLRFYWGAVFPSPAYMRWRYPLIPAWLWPLAYPYRWWRGLLKLVFNAPDTPPPRGEPSKK